MKEVPFMITAKQNDYVQGFCTFFTVKFSADIRHRELNTDPLLTPKHLGQTCFYLKDYFMIKKKEKIKGSLSFFTVNNDTRFLGVIIGIYFQGKMSEVLDVKTFILRP